MSRCQRFDLHRIPANLIAQHLQLIAGKEKITLDPAAAHSIARGAEGGLRDAESMLDQLVAFCGEKIAEADVLDVFGFTSQQTVAGFTEKILCGATADAVQLLHEQSEAGKDMMKLMSDLISYLRDLLVFKVKPDALNEDVDLDLQKSLAAQAQLIETDRLLELIDQFAEAEGRMKWAPNKKLHFEVALIKAIQTLSQVTLNEVIENLNALRDGKPTPPSVSAKKSSPVAAGVSPASKKAAADTAASTAPRVAEQASQYMPPASEAMVDPVQVWEQVSAKVPPQKRFLRSSIGSAHVIGVEGRNLLLGFSPEQKPMMDILGTQANRKFLETLLHEITGKDWSVKISLKEELPPKHATAQTELAEGSKTSGTADFKDDPLIQEALEMFKGEIKT